ncbi:MAG: SLBB domain-containing protein [Deltaproteobacteria bacterium]|nr:SLBB domain-containing protein [Deltaproteobacteria bacterium]
MTKNIQRHLVFHRMIKYQVYYVLILTLINSLVYGPVFAQSPSGLYLYQNSGDISGAGSQPGAMGNTPGASLSPARSLSYQVHILGEVKKPGLYQVTPSMRVTDLLEKAGGINPNGSMRFVEYRRQGETKGRVLDLFAYQTEGKLVHNPYLQDNVVVFVPLRKKVVEIEGPVRRPGTYEIKSEHSLYALSQLAGGFTVGASEKEAIKVIRHQGREEKQIFEIPRQTEMMTQFALEDGDFIVIPHKFLTKHEFDYNLKTLPNDNIYYPSNENQIYVIGAVRRPGPIGFNQYHSLRHYLTMAGGLTPMSKKKKIKVMRSDGRTFLAKNGEFSGEINPGDTIIVPEKRLPPEYYINLLTTIASLGLSAVAIINK